MHGNKIIDDVEIWARSLIAANSPYAYIALEAVEVFTDINKKGAD